MKEIVHVKDFKKWLDGPEHNHMAIQGLELDQFSSKLRALHIHDCIFLGCKASNELFGYLVSNGNMVIQNNNQFKFKTHRNVLYTVEELFEGYDENEAQPYFKTLDYKIYEDYLKNGKAFPNSILVSLNRRLHDHSITDALHELIDNQKVVAIMGGHSMERNHSGYAKIARISRKLCREGYLLVSGGGPGAMEACHLGAYFSGFEDHLLDEAFEILRPRPKNATIGKEYNDNDWLHRAMKVRNKFPIDTKMQKQFKSIGIPTWLYGHEPPAVFATHIAKYFANSVREDGLLTIARHGVIFAPGSAGTTQEIFQDACQNHYAAYNTDATNLNYISPMILMDKDYWTNHRPAWHLLNTVSKKEKYGDLVYLLDDENEIVKCILNYVPADYKYPATFNKKKD